MKRVLSLVLALVLVLGMMPTFAASATGAEELSAYGFISGGDNGDLMVDKTLTRAEMAVILSQLYGVKDKAEAFVAPANFTDVNGHWADSYIAYGQAAEWFGGYPDHTYRPDATVSAQELAAYALNALGYTGDYDFATADDFAATLGINVGSDAAVTRGEAFESLWTVVNTPKKGSEVSLGVELGKLEANTPAAGDLAVERVYSDNLKQIFVEFNQPVDKDSATTVGNYKIVDDKTTLKTAENSEEFKVELLADGKTVAITLNKAADQQDVFKITAEDVKNADKTKKVVKAEKEIQFLDTQLPEILNAEVIGSNAIKVTFSEPVNAEATDIKDAFKVNDGKYYVNKVEGQKNNTELIVKLYTTLKSGDLPFEVTTTVKDYAGFSAIGKKFNLTVVEDTTAPVVTGYKSAKETEVVLTWSEDLDKANVVAASNDKDKSKYYHTNSSNFAREVEVDGNEMTLTFDKDLKLAPGTSYVYVLKDAVRDLWGNKNTQQMQAVEVVLDKTPPELTGVEYDSKNVVKATFSEAVDADSVKRDNITLLNSDGKEVSTRAYPTTSDKTVTIEFKSLSKDLDGDYTLVVEGVKDIAGNEMAKTSVPFTAVDKEAPTIPEHYNFYGNLDNEYVYTINFGEQMMTSGQYSVLDLANYVLHVGSATYDLNDYTDDVSIHTIDNGEGVEIRIAKENTMKADDKKLTLTSTNAIEIARVADDNGNVTDTLSKLLSPAGTTNVLIKKAEITGDKELKLTLDAVSKFVAEDFQFTYTPDVTTGYWLVPSEVTTVTESGKTVATFTFSGDTTNGTVTTDDAFKGFDAATKAADNNGALQLTVDPATAKTTNDYGDALALAGDYKVVDKQAPSIVVSDKLDQVLATTSATADSDTVMLVFDETIDSAYLALNSFEVDGRDINNITRTDVTVDGKAYTNNAIVLTLDSDSDFPLEQGVVVTLLNPIKDMNGNALSELSVEVQYVNGVHKK